jgi:hypothetical protein
MSLSASISWPSFSFWRPSCRPLADFFAEDFFEAFFVFLAFFGVTFFAPFLAAFLTFLTAVLAAPLVAPAALLIASVICSRTGYGACKALPAGAALQLCADSADTAQARLCPLRSSIASSLRFRQ